MQLKSNNRLNKTIEKLVYNNSFSDYNRKQRKKRFMIKVKRKLKLRVCEFKLRVCELKRINDEFLHTQYKMFDNFNLEML